MTQLLNDKPDDDVVDALKHALDEYERAYPGAEASLYRSGPASVRIRVVDRHLEGMGKSKRHHRVWDFLAARVDEDAVAEVSQVLALAPAELGMSFINFEYERPIPINLVRPSNARH